MLAGHGGHENKRGEHLLPFARSFVRHLGVAVVAIDAPEHGDRMSDPVASEQRRQLLLEHMERNEKSLPTLSEDEREQATAHVSKHVIEWRALIDDLQTDDRWAQGPFGWWGFSMGTSHGVPVVAQESRISCAILGMNALRAGEDRLAEQAASISVPVLFLIQADDEFFTRDEAIALYDAIGSKEKTLHMNPGGHTEVPAFELDSFENFFRRHLLGH